MSARGDGRSRGEVIHVAFGPGGGRIEPRRAGKPAPPASPVATFTPTAAAGVLRLSVARLRRLEQACLPSVIGGKRRSFALSELLELRGAARLLRAGARIGVVIEAVRGARRAMPDRALSSLRFELDGKRVVVHCREGAFEPLTGQRLLGVEPPVADVVALRSSEGVERARQGYELYRRAAEIDEDPATMDEAERLYRRALELDPWLSIAYTNLGNIHYRRHDAAEAEALFRKALRLDPHQPEALYNLGHLRLEEGDAAAAIPLFVASLDSDPEFADAHFNLGMALEQVGRADESLQHWHRYIELEPNGNWAEIARRHLR
jgi:Flp pilus assembly protein TadD